MANVTLLRTISTVDDIRVGLNNGTLTRTMSIGTSWNYLRVGIRVSIDPTVYGTPNLGKNIFIGVCSGATYGWNNGSATTTHAVGALSPSTGNSSNAPASSTSGGVNGFIFYNPKGAKRVGTTVTESSGVLIGTVYLQANSDYRAGMWFVDIEKKTSPTDWNIKSWMLANLPTTHNTKSDFTNYMVVPFASLSLSGYSASTTVTLPVDEATNGYLDTVNVFSDMTGNLEISDIAVAKFS